jgi:hypothetical protein
VRITLIRHGNMRGPRAAARAIALAALVICSCSHGAALTGGSSPPDGPCVGATARGAVTLAPQSATSLAVDDHYVYFTGGHGILRVPRAGGDVTTLVEIESPSVLAIDATDAYFFGLRPAGPPDAQGKVQSAVGLFSAPLAGGDARLLVADAYGQYVVPDRAGGVYWASTGSLQHLRAGESVPTSSKLDPAPSLESLVLGSNALFAAVYSYPPGSGSIERIPLDGGAPAILVSGLGHPTSVAVDETNLYFTEEAPYAPSSRVTRARLDGSEVTTTFATGVAVDRHAVFFSTPDAVHRIDKSGGAVTTLATGLESPDYLVVTGGNVYWANATTPSGSDPSPPYAVMTSCK